MSSPRGVALDDDHRTWISVGLRDPVQRNRSCTADKSHDNTRFSWRFAPILKTRVLTEQDLMSSGSEASTRVALWAICQSPLPRDSSPLRAHSIRGQLMGSSRSQITHESRPSGATATARRTRLGEAGRHRSRSASSPDPGPSRRGTGQSSATLPTLAHSDPDKEISTIRLLWS